MLSTLGTPTALCREQATPIPAYLPFRVHRSMRIGWRRAKRTARPCSSHRRGSSSPPTRNCVFPLRLLNSVLAFNLQAPPGKGGRSAVLFLPTARPLLGCNPYFLPAASLQLLRSLRQHHPHSLTASPSLPRAAFHSLQPRQPTPSHAPSRPQLSTRL